MKYPEVGDKFYYKNCYGELIQKTCVRIEKKEGVETMYFTCWDENGGLFVSESSILDPDSEEVKELIAEKEKEEWRKFWTKERIQEAKRYLVEHIHIENLLSVTFEDFINYKLR